MTIQLPKDVESSINAEVLSGHFASVDDAIAEAWRNFLRQKPQAQHPAGLGSIGAMRDAADELDAITADAMMRRQERSSGESSSGVRESMADTPLDSRPIWEVVDELRQGIPAEEFNNLPADGAQQLDHYLYGSPKRPIS